MQATIPLSGAGISVIQFAINICCGFHSCFGVNHVMEDKPIVRLSRHMN
jgi:hypothetical protein